MSEVLELLNLERDVHIAKRRLDEAFERFCDAAPSDRARFRRASAELDAATRAYHAAAARHNRRKADDFGVDHLHLIQGGGENPGGVGAELELILTEREPTK